MESQSGLGIYVSKSRATVVCLNRHKVTACFAVTPPEESTEPMVDMLRGVAESCAEKRLKYADATVALDCTWFMQHRVHSEFTNAKQIGATIRFDTEEVVATDIANLAVGFEAIATNETGTDLNVFTADHAILSDVVLTLQSHGIDPVRVVPDVCSLARVIGQSINAKTYSYSHGLFGILSRRNGYFLRYAEKQGCVPVRAFLAGTQNKNELLAREAFTTMASMSEAAAESLMVYDATDGADPAVLAERLSLPVEAMDWLVAQGAGPQAINQGDDPVDCAIALGAARMAGESSLNFRNDFLPAQGKRLRLQSAMKWMCFSVTLLLLAVGGRLQATWFQARQDRDSLFEKLHQDYQAVMLGSKKKTNLVSELAREKRKITALKEGQISLQGANSTSAKLILILRAINACYGKAGLEVKDISIGSAVKVSGSAAQADGRQEFAKAIEATGLGNAVGNYVSEAQGRWPFSITVDTKAGGRKP